MTCMNMLSVFVDEGSLPVPCPYKPPTRALATAAAVPTEVGAVQELMLNTVETEEQRDA